MRIAKALQLLSPETAHKLALKAAPLAPAHTRKFDPLLHTQFNGLRLEHPLGLAAGFDKNGEAVDAMLRLGFAMVEIGTVTLHPQTGNPRPRVFRLLEDRAVINRLGFNNAGLGYARDRLARLRRQNGVVGVNIGINKATTTPIDDYIRVFETLSPHVDYVTVNVSSPNTPGLRAWQHGDHLKSLLERLVARRNEGSRKLPLFVKIAPDQTLEDEPLIVETTIDCGIEGLIVGNTTLSRPTTLRSRQASEAGGLSGAPLFDPSTALCRRIAGYARNRLAIIGVGGVFSGTDAYAKIRAGASAIQIYTSLIYEGPGVIDRILDGLAAHLKRDGYANLRDAVGADLVRT